MVACWEWRWKWLVKVPWADGVAWDRESGEARALHEGKWERMPSERRLELLSFLDQIGTDLRIKWIE